MDGRKIKFAINQRLVKKRNMIKIPRNYDASVFTLAFAHGFSNNFYLRFYTSYSFLKFTRLLFSFVLFGDLSMALR